MATTNKRFVLASRPTGEPTPTITVLVPSYREDTRVIRQTLLSA